MTKEDTTDGWWHVSFTEQWACPECKTLSDVAEWDEVEPGCEDCGNHDGRECPNCGEWFDHVWGSGLIQTATEEALGETND